MGTVIKKTATKRLPEKAEIFTRKGERFGRWKDRKGKTRTALLTVGKDGSERIVIESSRYFAKFRDGAGIVRTVATGCRDEQAARRVLGDLERRAELVKAGVMTPAEITAAEHQGRPLSEHLNAYDEHLRAKNVTKTYREEIGCYLRRLAAECSFGFFADLRREALERWLAARAAEGLSARGRNAYRDALVTFCNWAVETHRLTLNPFTTVAKVNVKADPRRQRRAMDEPELVKLLAVARERPLLDALTVHKGPRKGERYATVRPEVCDRLGLLGRERALTYKTLVLTGLRKGELASLTVAHLRLDDAVPYLTLDPGDEKNREGNSIPLRDDLAADLRAWLAEKLDRMQKETLDAGRPIPARLPPDTPVFTIPRRLERILDRDLRFAGIPKRDDRGRTLDVHALRTTFGTLLSKGGVPLRTAQAAMRHSDPRLTANVYTDPRLLDVRGALDALPPLPLEGKRAEGEALRATGTDTGAHECLVQTDPRKFAPGFAPTLGHCVQEGSFSGNPSTCEPMYQPAGTVAVNPYSVNKNGRLSLADNRPFKSG